MPLPWQKKALSTSQPVKAGVLTMTILRVCQDERCPFYHIPRTGAEKQCVHQQNEDQGVVSTFGDATTLVSQAYQASGTDSGIVAAARRYVEALELAEKEGGEHAGRANTYLEQLKFEVNHNG
jgi:hypothetical protein